MRPIHSSQSPGCSREWHKAFNKHKRAYFIAKDKAEKAVKESAIGERVRQAETARDVVHKAMSDKLDDLATQLRKIQDEMYAVRNNFPGMKEVLAERKDAHDEFHRALMAARSAVDKEFNCKIDAEIAGKME